MKAVKLPLLAAGGLLSLVLASCSSDLKDSDYPATALKTLPPAPASLAVPATAYKNILWTDSVKKVEALFKDSHPWTGNPFGVYTRNQILDSVLLEAYLKNAPALKEGETRDPEKDLAEARKLLTKNDREDFIIRQIAFQSGKSDVTVYWFEVNNPARPSRFVDDIVWSKMCLVRILHVDPPVAFAKVLAAEKDRFGEPSVKELKDSDVWSWYKKLVNPKTGYIPVKEYLWKKDALTVALYDWKNPEDKTGFNELTLRNEAVFQEFEGKIRERVEANLKASKAQLDESTNQALSR